MSREPTGKEDDAIDLAEHRRMQRVLKERERFLNGILDSVQDGISLLDRDLTIRRVNR